MHSNRDSASTVQWRKRIPPQALQRGAGAAAAPPESRESRARNGRYAPRRQPALAVLSVCLLLLSLLTACGGGSSANTSRVGACGSVQVQGQTDPSPYQGSLGVSDHTTIMQPMLQNLCGIWLVLGKPTDPAGLTFASVVTAAARVETIPQDTRMRLALIAQDLPTILQEDNGLPAQQQADITFVTNYLGYATSVDDLEARVGALQTSYAAVGRQDVTADWPPLVKQMVESGRGTIYAKDWLSTTLQSAGVNDPSGFLGNGPSLPSTPCAAEPPPTDCLALHPQSPYVLPNPDSFQPSWLAALERDEGTEAHFAMVCSGVKDSAKKRACLGLAAEAATAASGTAWLRAFVIYLRGGGR